jgi:hypothetical protein
MVITYCFFLSICCVVSAAIYDFLWSMFIMFCFPFLLTLYMYDLSLVCLFICVYLEFGYAGPRCREVDIFSMRAAKPEVGAVQEKEGMDHACPREEGRGEARAGATYGLTTALSRGQAAARIHSPSRSRSRTGGHNYPLLPSTSNSAPRRHHPLSGAERHTRRCSTRWSRCPQRRLPSGCLRCTAFGWPQPLRDGKRRRRRARRVGRFSRPVH